MFILMLLSAMMLTMASAMLISLNPLSMGIIILGIALTLTLIYSQMLTSWVAFLIFLIYIGGMLVMFTYFVALTPNQQTSMMTTPMIIMMTTALTLTNMMNTLPMSSLNSKYMYTFYLSNNIQLLFILALILLFTMVVVVKLVMNNKGPLRPFLN